MTIKYQWIQGMDGGMKMGVRMELQMKKKKYREVMNAHLCNLHS